MTSLFLDTSSSYLTIAILKDNKILQNIYMKTGNDLSKYVLIKIKELLEQEKLEPNNIDEIICVNGPGSFTSLRIGVTIAKTYAWGLNKKIIPVSSLFTMATSIKDYDFIIPVIDARHNHVFAGIYNNNYQIIMEDKYISINDLLKEIAKLKGKYIIVSSDNIDEINTIKYKPNIENLFCYLNKVEIDPHKFVPNYLKQTEAEEHLND